MALEIHDRRCEVDFLDFSAPEFKVKTLRGVEKLSSLFHLTLELASTDENVQAKDVVGTRIKVTVPLKDGGRRYFHGVVSRFTQLGSFGDEERALIGYQAIIVPWLWTLTRSQDCRTFEDKSVIQITKEIFGKYSYGDVEIPKDYAEEEIDYCVQYRETDFEFLSRLWEQWGLGYMFRHDDKKHLLILFDDSKSLVDGQEEDVSVDFEGEEGAGVAGDVDKWKDRQEMHTAKYVLDDYRFKDPEYDYKADQPAELVMPKGSKYEFFDYPGAYVVEDDGKTADRAQLFTRMRMEAEEAESRRIDGRGVCTEFAAGVHFTMNKHFNDAAYNGKKFLLTEVRHILDQPVGTEKEPTMYRNEFACLPASIPYRPKQKTRKPLIHGAQTALVVGKADGVAGKDEEEEIHTDEHGRIRIRFHWNRHSDRKDLCWARVQQSLAGPKYGTQFLPRVGHEVVVNFLEGDPDQPLVIGCVYNGKNKPPFTLTENKTQSGWKTRSSKEGTDKHYNEIRFEDKKGSEQLVIHAEKAMNTSVEADSSLTVGGKLSETVDKGHTLTVKEGGYTFEVGDGGASHTVKGLTGFYVDGLMEGYAGEGVHLDGRGNQCPAIPQVQLSSDHIKLEMGSSKITATTDQVELKVGGSTVTIVDGTITVAADNVTVNSKTATVNGDGGKVVVTGDVEIEGGTVKATGNTINLNS